MTVDLAADDFDDWANGEPTVQAEFRRQARVALRARWVKEPK